MQQIYHTWSHQIIPGGAEKLVYGRGSPEIKFEAKEWSTSTRSKFEGALPTTTYQAGFSEIYGQNPDIDSTSLMISTTSWILPRLLNYKEDKRQKPQEDHLYEGFSILPPSSIIASEHAPNDVSTYLLSKADITDPFKVAEFAVPRMLKGIGYLKRRDVDNDGLLEQNYNEDWMDTALRTGKIVYSQACWIHAFWPWTTGIEMLARSRFNKLQECDILLSGLSSDDGDPHPQTFYEWINPITGEGAGAYPFRTGIFTIHLLRLCRNHTIEKQRLSSILDYSFLFLFLKVLFLL